MSPRQLQRSILILGTLGFLAGCEESQHAPNAPAPSTQVALRVAEAPPGFLEATDSIYIRATTGAGALLVNSMFAFQRGTSISLTLPVDQSLELLVQGFDKTGILFWLQRVRFRAEASGYTLPLRLLPIDPTLDSSGILVGRTEPVQIQGGRLDSLGYLIPDSGAQYISLSSATPTASIRYTEDGSPPSWASPLVTSPVRINPDYTYRFIAMAPRMMPSPILQVSFRDPDPCNCYLQPFAIEFVYPTDPLDPSRIVTTGAYKVALRRTNFLPDLVVRYSRDGSDPDWASPAFPETLLVTSSYRLKMAAFRGLDRSSDILDTLLRFGPSAN